MKQIIIQVSADGEIKIDAVGFKGAACEKATAAIEKALAGGKRSGGKRPEYYHKNTLGQSQGA